MTFDLGYIAERTSSGAEPVPAKFLVLMFILQRITPTVARKKRLDGRFVTLLAGECAYECEAFARYLRLPVDDVREALHELEADGLISVITDSIGKPTAVRVNDAHNYKFKTKRN